MQFCNALLLLFLLAASVSTVLGFPSQPGSCIGGQAAVGAPHLSASSVTTGTLMEGGLSISVNGNTVPEGAAVTLPVGVEHIITLEVTGSNPGVTFFRGYLIRLGSTDISTVRALQPVDRGDWPGSSLCFSQNAGHVGHLGNLEKTTASGAMMLSSPAADMPLDVTVVVSNRNGVSEYYYANYTISVQDGTAAPVTPAPPVMKRNFKGEKGKKINMGDSESSSRAIPHIPVFP